MKVKIKLFLLDIDDYLGDSFMLTKSFNFLFTVLKGLIGSLMSLLYLLKV